ncbi:MAG: glycosyltransferase family 39 protein [Candidatus Nanoarchaeia archaeon]|nr:glycosyltransferase family 39 protein [Candidatus Nanoarchaeia archaeon]
MLNKISFKNACIFSAIIVFFLIMCLVRINKPLTDEQTFLVYGANAIINTGASYFSFEGPNLLPTTGIEHPPLYLYTLVLFIQLFGYNLFGLKFSGIFFTILNSILIYFMTKLIIKDNKLIPFLASFLYLIHPLVFENAVFLSLDGGILTFSTILFIYVFLKYKLEKPIWLVLIFLFSLWIKFTSFPVLIASVFFYYLFFEKENKFKNIFNLGLISLISVFLFGLTFYIYSYLINYDFLHPFIYLTAGKFGHRTSILLNLLRSAYVFKSFIFWITPPLFIYIIYKLFSYTSKTIKKELPFPTSYLFCYLFSALAFFTALGVDYLGFPKHYIILLPVLSIILAIDIFRNFKDFKISYDLLIILLLVPIYLFIFVKDPMYYDALWKALPIIDSSIIWMVLDILKRLALILLPLPILFLYFKYYHKKGFLFSVVFYSLILMIYSSAYLIYVPYNTGINQGDTGLQETIDYLKMNVNQSTMATLLVPQQINFIWNNGKDLAYIGNNAYLYNVKNYYLFSKLFFNKVIIQKDNTYLVLYERDLHRTKGIKEITESNFDFVKDIGTYKIYKIRKGITNFNLLGYEYQNE